MPIAIVFEKIKIEEEEEGRLKLPFYAELQLVGHVKTQAGRCGFGRGLQLKSAENSRVRADAGGTKEGGNSDKTHGGRWDMDVFR